MAFLNINGWRIPVKSCSLQPFEIGTRERAVDGSLNVQRRAVKRKWKVETQLLRPSDGRALWNLVQGRGQQWRFDGLTSPQDTTVAAVLASAQGSVPSNTPVTTIERTTAVDGNPVKWQHGAATFIAPSAYGAGALWVPGTMSNIWPSAVATCQDATTWSGIGGCTDTADTTYKWQGTGSIKLAFAAGVVGPGTRYGECTSAVACTNGVKYVISFYVFSTVGGTIGFIVHDGTTFYESATATVPANTWCRCFLAITGGAVANRFLRLYSNDAGVSDWWIDGCMWEQYTWSASNVYFADPWVDGTRTGVGVTYSPNIVRAIASGSYTVSAWVRAAAYPAADEVVVHWSQSGVNRFYLNLLASNGRAATAQSNGAGAAIATVSGTTAIAPAAAWYHLASVFDRVAGTTTLYVNGVVDGSAAHAAVAPADMSNAATFAIGSLSSATTSNRLQGGVDEVTVLPFAASAGLVAAMALAANNPAQSFPRLLASGDAIDGEAIVIGNTSQGSYTRTMRSGVGSACDYSLSFDLEEI